MRCENDRGKRAAGYRNPIAVGAVLLVAGAAVAMIQYKVPTILTDLMAMFSMDAETASWLMSVFTLASIFVALPSGMLAQRFGAKRMIVVALGIAAAGSLIGLAAQTSVVLIASRAVEGAALTILTTGGPVVVQSCVRSDKVGTALGIWGIWGCLGSSVAAVVTPTVFESLGFGGVWVVFAVFAVVAAAVVSLMIRVPAGERENRDGGRLSAADAIPTKGGSAAGLIAGSEGEPMGRAQGGVSDPPRYRELLTRDIALFFVGLATFNVCLLAVLAFVPTILQMQGFGPTLSGFISTAPMLLSIVSSPLFGAVSDRIGRCKPLLAASMLTMGPCTYALYTDTGLLMWCAVAIMGLVGMGAVGLFLSAYMKLLPRPELASIGMGVLVLVQGVGQFLGTFLVQMLLGPSLTEWAFAGGALMALGFLGVAALLACRMR